VRSEEPVFFGTFHFGASDLLGFLLSDHGRRVSIVRLRVANSDDVRLLGNRYGGQVSILWANDPGGLLFELKATIESGASIAMQCDRIEPGAKVEPFLFLGERRRFPFSIYHLAILFGRPVMFCVAVPHPRNNELRVFASPVFRPDPALGRTENLPAARRHFQAVLTEFEQLVREYPLLWFNFLPLNPVVSAPLPSGPEA
jgi:lauroyl/myristoyl acyltransferase